MSTGIVNRYMDLITSRKPKTVCAFNSYLYQSLRYGGYSSVRHWTENINLFTRHMVFIPVVIDDRWSLIHINMKTFTLTYYNSPDKMHHGDTVMQMIIMYLLDELKDKRSKPHLSEIRWTLVKVTDWPDKLSELTSGILVCKYADYLSRGKPIQFSPGNIPVYKKQIILEIRKMVQDLINNH